MRVFRGRRGAVAGSFLAVLAIGSLALTGCTIERSDAQEQSSQQSAEAEAEEAQAPVISVDDGDEDVDPSESVIVKSMGDGLSKVTMTNEEGYEVESELSDDGRSWTTAETLGYNRTYTIKATDKNGETATASFSTATPAATTNVALSPLADSVVGVGQTIGFRFGSPVKDRQAAQDAITVTTSPKVEGGFYWLNNSELRWRPAEYWEPGTEVTVEADIYGKDLGGGVWGETDNATNFTIGDKVEAVADDATKTMSVYKNGELLRTVPVSFGRDTSEWATPNGTYIIGDRNESMIMDSTTFGLGYEEGGYRTPVKYATQMSYSGIYVHAAPWSVGAQGSYNTSHGCINVSTENAQWFQETVKRGDIVTVKNTIGETLSGYDGLGDWNIPWSEWSKGNADQTSAW
ncbi:L,D-transpeptidase [Corynebacterium glutamicum]|uniref:L,D-transpeptidase n=1 Tax=Corynebacterium glutamicum TaxID=1718 RepID=UPI000942005C|nr:Ig-like domain-containing protein [Corynebacterium glutamicum]OKX84662.1 transpeptidase [Corynebacterium glutamicum]QDX76332.1 transpeptidase [Corynebacterium glutamicum]QDX79108.1 transpeptidase [Corynebacterium glutamicum]TWS33015.1 transpeptidase [Corynebacterium glutamicum]TWS33078.1 transpeptidase [Corynebacterium glutamicum]